MGEFLEYEEKIQYLIERKYANNIDDFNDSNVKNIKNMNFHYFLNYAHNYKTFIKDNSNVEEENHIDNINKIIFLDHKLALLLYEGIRKVEWYLRAVLVTVYSKEYNVSGCFIPDTQFKKVNNLCPIEEKICEQIFRSSESFISNTIAQKAKELNKNKEYLSNSEKIEIIKYLPIWTQIDSWNLKLIYRFIEESVNSYNGDSMLSLVAKEVGISKSIFLGCLDAIISLRNLVAHNSRLWKRPTTYSSKIPKVYRKKAEKVGDKAIYTTIIAIAYFLKKYDEDEDFINKVDALLSEYKIYELGIKKPL